MDNKICTFEGTQTRYKMKQILRNYEKEGPKPKKYLISLNLQTDSSLSIFENPLVKKEIMKKLSGYKQQDIKKKMFHSDLFISLDQCITLLTDCSYNCYYCKENTLLVYDIVREPRQWTLDRIDNFQGHNEGNVLISCLECNLKRRRIGKDNFLFTKQLKIKRDEYIYVDDEETKHNHNNVEME